MSYLITPPLYSTWCGMKSRCNNPNNPHYKNYGGRGITVCAEWSISYHAFIADMGLKPVGTTLDRIDNNQGYSKANCKWSTHKEQQRNQRVNRFITVDNVIYKVADLAEQSGLKSDTIISRSERGFTLPDILAKTIFRDLAGLSLGAQASSIARKARTHCKYGHPFIDGLRKCNICKAANARKRNQIKRGC